MKDFYQKRKCSKQFIAKQIFLCLQYVYKKWYSHTTFEQVLSWSQQYNQQVWLEYRGELGKYLILA